MKKTLTILISLLLIFISGVVFGQGFEQPNDITPIDEKVDNFITALKEGNTVVFRLITYDILAGKYKSVISDECGGDRTPNIIDTLRCEALNNEIDFIEVLCDGDASDESESRRNVIMATIQGLYNLDPRVRLIAIEWLRRLRPDAMMFRDVERAVEYETVASSYEKYRPKNIDIPSIDEPGSPGLNIDPSGIDSIIPNKDGENDPSTYTNPDAMIRVETGKNDTYLDDQYYAYGYHPPEKSIYVSFDDHEGNPTEKVNVSDEFGNIVPLTGPRYPATQLDARKWGNGNPWDPDFRQYEINKYIDVMTQAGALRRFRNLNDAYLLGYQYRLGSYYDDITNADFENLKNSDLSAAERQAIYDRIEKCMVPIGHGDKYMYRNSNGQAVMGNSWAELVKLREFIVRAIWYHKIKSGDLNSLVIVSKDTFKTLYLSIDGEAPSKVPFLSIKRPRDRMLNEADVPVLAQGLLKNPVYSTKWVIARALKDIYDIADKDETKRYINLVLRQAKYDALAKDVISGAILHEELITVGKINVRDGDFNGTYPIVGMKDDLDDPGIPVYSDVDKSGTFAGGVYIPRKTYKDVQKTDTVRKPDIQGFGIPNDESLARRHAKLIDIKPKEEHKGGVAKNKYNLAEASLGFNWYYDRDKLKGNELYLLDRVLDSFTFYTYGINDYDDDNYFDGNGTPEIATSIPIRLEEHESGVRNTTPTITYYSDRNEYYEAKSVFYKYNHGIKWEWDDAEKKTGHFDYSNCIVDQDDDAIKNNPKIRKVLPYFNVEHYNRVSIFINAILAGNNEIMANVEWNVVESAELLTLYRLYKMLNKESYYSPKSVELDSIKRITFFDALQKVEKAIIQIRSGLEGIDSDEPADKVPGGADGTFKYFDQGTYTVREKRLKFNTIANENLLDDLLFETDFFSDDDISPRPDFSQSKRNMLVASSLSGLYNKDPRIRLTAIHWLRRLEPSEEMYDEVKKVRGIILQNEISGDDSFDDIIRSDRPETEVDKYEFLDTNIYSRNDNPDLNDRIKLYPQNTNVSKDGSNVTDGILADKFVHAFGDMKVAVKDDNKVEIKGFANTNNVNNDYFKSMILVISKDFESFNYEQFKNEELAEKVTFYDMKPNYTAAQPNIDPRFPDFHQNPDADIDDILQIITVANPWYTEDTYEYYFRSYGLYQFKSPSEELEKLYRFIQRERLVNRIKNGREIDIFVSMTRFDFSVLALKLDDEYMLRIPMQSFFGFTGNVFDNSSKFFDKPYTIDINNGDYNSSRSFLLPKGSNVNVNNSYRKYPIFRESQVQLIKQGYDNPNFIVQKGTAEYLIRFYNFYSNIEDGVKKDIRDAFFYYKNDDIVIEEVTLAFEAEQPEGRSVIKAGTKLGNDLNSGGVKAYKSLPVELRKDIRRTINREVQSFEREIASILGVRRKIAVGEEDHLGYFTPDMEYVPVKPIGESDVKGEEKDKEGSGD